MTSQGFADRYDANLIAKNVFAAHQIVSNRFDSRAHDLISKMLSCDGDRRAAIQVADAKQGLRKEGFFTSRIGLVRVLCFTLGRGRLPTATRTLASIGCVPAISLFDPPTYVAATLSIAAVSFTEHAASATKAAAHLGLAQRFTEPPPALSNPVAQDIPFNPRQYNDRRYVARPAVFGGTGFFCLGKVEGATAGSSSSVFLVFTLLFESRDNAANSLQFERRSRRREQGFDYKKQCWASQQ
jgi:hypothetical protein